MTASRSYITLITVLVLSLGTIILAWGFQLIGGYLPCALCYQQRWPYYATILIALALVAMARGANQAVILRWGLLLLAVIMAVSVGLGVHHAGVEWGWWAGPTSCAGGAGFADPNSVLPDLTRGRVVSCTEAQWRLFGISFAGYNALISLVIAAIALCGALLSRAPDQGSNSVSQ